ncbi:hypothetical protein [Streptomyces sp. NPDC001889]
MGRGAQSQSQSLARVAVVVRAGAAPLWWLGVLAAAIGALVPGLTGRRIGVLSGAALLLVTAAVTALARRSRYAALAEGAGRAGRGDYLQDRRVTLRRWRRAHRWGLLGGFVVAVGSAFVVPAAGGMVLAGAGAGLWGKAVWLGWWERGAERLLWVSADRALGSPAGRRVESFRATGPAAGDARPGGTRRRP